MDRALITIHLHPGARRSEVIGWTEGALRISVQAPASEGRANEALVRLLADVLGIAKSRVSILRGATRRVKLMLIEGLTLEEVLRKLEESAG